MLMPGVAEDRTVQQTIQLDRDTAAATIGSDGTLLNSQLTPSVSQQRASEDTPVTDVEASSQLVADLWELSAQHLEPRFWPLSRRRRQYRRLLSAYCEILPTVKHEENRGYLLPTLIGIRHLREGNLAISNAIIESVKFHILTGESLLYIMKGLRDFVLWAFAVIYMAMPLLFALLIKEGYDWTNVTVSNPKLRDGYIALFFGIVGSVVSLLTRMPEFEKVSLQSQRYLIYTGATSPIIGGTFALVVAALIQSNLIGFGPTGPTVSPDSSYWLYIVIGFLSGFSERFSSSLLRIAQGRISTTGIEKRVHETPGEAHRTSTKS